jgi:hypothetical protein
MSQSPKILPRIANTYFHVGITRKPFYYRVLHQRILCMQCSFSMVDWHVNLYIFLFPPKAQFTNKSRDTVPICENTLYHRMCSEINFILWSAAHWTKGAKVFKTWQYVWETMKQYLYICSKTSKISFFGSHAQRNLVLSYSMHVLDALL